MPTGQRVRIYPMLRVYYIVSLVYILINLIVLAVPCHREGCNGTEAFFNQVQIRSADEPMTTFYRVSPVFFGTSGCMVFLHADCVSSVQPVTMLGGKTSRLALKVCPTMFSLPRIERYCSKRAKANLISAYKTFLAGCCPWIETSWIISNP